MKRVLVILGLVGIVAVNVVAQDDDERNQPPPKRDYTNPCVHDKATEDYGFHEDLAPLEETAQVDLKSLLAEKPPGRVNGVTLRIAAKQVVAKDANQIVVEWAVTYTGPRSSLVMLKPCLSQCNLYGGTRLALYAVGRDGKAYRVTFRSPVPLGELIGPIWPVKECYLTVPAGRTTSGSIRVSTEQFRRRLLENHLDQFDLDRQVIPKLYVKLYHEPMYRGKEHDLDAWTGKLESNVAPLKLSQW